MHAKHGLCIALAAAVGFAAGLAIASRPPQCPAHRPTPWPTHGQLWQVLSIQTEFRQAGLTVEGSLAPDATPQRPEIALRDYFAASAARDSAAVRRLLTTHRWQNSLPWSEDPNLISIRLRAIGGPREGQEESYRVTHPEFFAVRALPASFEVRFKEERSVTNGTHTWVYYLVRERPDSPWLIADWGH